MMAYLAWVPIILAAGLILLALLREDRAQRRTELFREVAREGRRE